VCTTYRLTGISSKIPLMSKECFNTGACGIIGLPIPFSASTITMLGIAVILSNSRLA